MACDESEGQTLEIAPGGGLSLAPPGAVSKSIPQVYLSSENEYGLDSGAVALVVSGVSDI